MSNFNLKYIEIDRDRLAFFNLPKVTPVLILTDVELLTLLTLKSCKLQIKLPILVFLTLLTRKKYAT